MLENVPIFAGLGESELAALQAHAAVKQYPKNVILIQEGDETDSLYVILEGSVKVFASDESGKEVILRMHGAGEHFGELALLDTAPRSASVMTLEPTRCLVVAKRDFDRCLAESPEIARNVIQVLAARVRTLTENVKNLALLDVYGRVARTLLEMAVERDGKLAIERRLTHQEIANMVGASREMVTRILKDLAEGDYITIEDRRITINHRLPPGW